MQSLGAPQAARAAVFAAFAVIAGLLHATTANAATTTTTGAGSAVTSADRTATFDSLTTGGIDLSAYTEGQLRITVDDVTHTSFDPFFGAGSGGFHYGNAGNESYVTITTTDDMVITGLEFLIGDGWPDANSANDTYVVWQTLLDGVEVGSGSFQTVDGTIVGWSDAIGFDTLRVGAYYQASYTTLGQYQAIALDDVSVQLASAAAVPLPAALPLFASALGGKGLIGWRRRRKA